MVGGFVVYHIRVLPGPYNESNTRVIRIKCGKIKCMTAYTTITAATPTVPYHSAAATGRKNSTLSATNRYKRILDV